MKVIKFILRAVIFLIGIAAFASLLWLSIQLVEYIGIADYLRSIK